MATYIRPYSEVDGAIGEASSINKYIDDFVSTVNSLNSQNLADSAVGTTQLEDSAVTTSKVQSAAITWDKTDFELTLMKEVF